MSQSSSNSNWRQRSHPTNPQSTRSAQPIDQQNRRTGLRAAEPSRDRIAPTTNSRPKGKWVPPSLRNQPSTDSRSPVSNEQPSRSQSHRKNNRHNGTHPSLRKHKEALQPNLRFRPSVPPTTIEEFPSFNETSLVAQTPTVPEEKKTTQPLLVGRVGPAPSWSQLVSQGPSVFSSTPTQKLTTPSEKGENMVRPPIVQTSVDQESKPNQTPTPGLLSDSILPIVIDRSISHSTTLVSPTHLVPLSLPPKEVPDWLAELPEALEPAIDPILASWLAEEESWDLKYHSYLLENQSKY